MPSAAIRTSCFFHPWPLILTEASSKLTSSTKDLREERERREREERKPRSVRVPEEALNELQKTQTHVGAKGSSKLNSLVEQRLVQVTTVDHESREAEALLEGSERSATELLVVGIATNRVALEANGL